MKIKLQLKENNTYKGSEIHKNILLREELSNLVYPETMVHSRDK